ncbi:uncharacterized protein B0J16DRAFT_313708 [Fusarium flagelliforme]|uniref:uncharacterized protein n=1 Tax=Fusarium flagelliforme TaxID=2675880 RepID=UPI001E8DA24B|nr:uncharacterized protein B0J16DRAFT_313708 [Fusarium flagelliforme]KAH7197385.1 hypothetical protein B0J16DRAFT_313708 [Fusarium flagelliforme]
MGFHNKGRSLSLFFSLVGLGRLGNWRKGETLNVPTRQGANNLKLLPSITWYKESYKKEASRNTCTQTLLLQNLGIMPVIGLLSWAATIGGPPSPSSLKRSHS